MVTVTRVGQVPAEYEGYLRLVSEIIRLELTRVGGRWLDTRTGRAWLEISGLNGQLLKEMIRKHGLPWPKGRGRKRRVNDDTAKE